MTSRHVSLHRAGDTGRAQCWSTDARNSGQIAVGYLSPIAADVGAEAVPERRARRAVVVPIVQPEPSIAGVIVPA